MKIKLFCALAALAAGAFAAVPAQMVITVQPARGNLTPADLTVLQGKTRVPVTGLERLSGSLAANELYIVLDDSTRSSSLGLQLPDLKRFIASLPATTQAAIGYIRNGRVAVAQGFTTDHAKAAAALRLPEAVAGANASPYFALSNLVSHWPSNTPDIRRTVLMFTDGVDRYYEDPRVIDDPYVDASIAAALKNGVSVYSVYLRGAGFYGSTGWVTSMAQSRLMQVSRETGGHCYEEDFTDPVSIQPFLADFQARLDNQYKVTFQALNRTGMQPIKLRTEQPGLKIVSPTRIYVQ